MAHEPEEVVICKGCKEALPLAQAVYTPDYWHGGCYARYEKALDNARDYQQTIADYRREKDGE
jgi:hypothetical protein